MTQMEKDWGQIIEGLEYPVKSFQQREAKQGNEPSAIRAVPLFKCMITQTSLRLFSGGTTFPNRRTWGIGGIPDSLSQP